MPAAPITPQTDHVITLPTRTDLNWYTFGITLDGIQYTFEFYWNGRANSGLTAVGTSGSWFFSLYDVSGNLLIAGIRVVLDLPLLFRYTAVEGLPAGVLCAQDTSGQELEAGQNDLGSRVHLNYFPADFTGTA